MDQETSVVSSSHHHSDADGRNDMVEHNTTTCSTSPKVINFRRRCWDEAFASESESTTPEPEDLQMENLQVDTTDDNGVNSSKKDSTAIVCEAHPGCLKSFKSVREYENHYNLRHRHKCITCSKSLPSAHILELHVLETHDTLFSLMAERKPMLACFLESCSSTFWKLEERKEHCLGQHGFPVSFKLWDLAAVAPSRANQLAKGKKTDKPKSKGKNQESFKDKMKTESVSSTSDIPVEFAPQNGIIEMDCLESEKKTGQTKPVSSSSKPKKGSSTKSHEKSTPNQITFGHSASRAFKPKYAFGLAKPQPKEHTTEVVVTSCKMDLSDIRDVLPATSST